MIDRGSDKSIQTQPVDVTTSTGVASTVDDSAKLTALGEIPTGVTENIIDVEL